MLSNQARIRVLFQAAPAGRAAKAAPTSALVSIFVAASFSLSTTTARAAAVGAGEINDPAKNSRLQQDAPSQQADGG